MKRVVVEKQKRILDDFFKVEEAWVSYERFDGSMTPVVRRLNFERGDSVAVLIFNAGTQRILMVSQFRYPTYAKGPGWITEIVAGMIDGDEAPEDAARREVEEETGFAVSHLEHIATFYVSPGGSSERIGLYYAEVVASDRVGAGGGLAAENEDILDVELTVSEAVREVQNGNIVDAKTIIGILWLRNRLAGGATSEGSR